MSDNDNKHCPLCGRETQGEETFCRNCQEIASDSYHSDLLSGDRDIEESIPEEKFKQEDKPEEVPLTENNNSLPEKEELSIPEEENKKNTFYRRNKKSLIFLFICLIFFMIVGFAGTYFRVQNMNSEETEFSYWNKCIEENTPLSYSKYLVKYPEGKFSEEAYQRIIDLRDEERKTWEKLRNSNNIDALFTYLTDNPQTPYAIQIRYAIDSLSWAAAQKENSAEVYLAYLDNVKIGRIDGQYENLARERYEYLSQLKTLEGKDLDEIKKVVSGFFKAMSAQNSKGIQGFSNDTLDRFYDSASFLSKNIADTLKSYNKANKIKSINYTPVTESIEAILDNKGICFASLPVKEEITYTDRKKKKVNSQSYLNIELRNNKIQAIYNKKK